jgi:hypothetical protein
MVLAYMLREDARHAKRKQQAAASKAAAMAERGGRADDPAAVASFLDALE